MRNATGGFTLVELLLVVVIIGILAAIVVPAVLPSAETARIKTAQGQLAEMRTHLESFALYASRYPTTEEGLMGLIARPPTLVLEDQWRGPYITAMTLPMDPWGRPYIYRFALGDPRYVLLSMGADGVEGTDDDITPQ